MHDLQCVMRFMQGSMLATHRAWCFFFWFAPVCRCCDICVMRIALHYASSSAIGIALMKHHIKRKVPRSDITIAPHLFVPLQQPISNC